MVVNKYDAVLLAGSGASPDNDRIARVLAFFGLTARAATPAEFFAGTPTDGATAPAARLLGSAEVFLGLLDGLETWPGGDRGWAGRVHSAFVYAGGNMESMVEVARRLSGDKGASAQAVDWAGGEMEVSGTMDDFTGVMSGLRLAASSVGVETGLVFKSPATGVANVISSGGKSLFVRLDYRGVPVFLVVSKNMVDLRAPVTGENFDVRGHFLEAVPVVLYVKWAFAGACWSAAETSACVVLDDPALKLKYGFVNFPILLEQMRSNGFCTSVGFIPWNWWRSDPKAAKLFRDNSACFSLSVHGSDHTRGEFATDDRRLLAGKSKQAARRMEAHRSRTGIQHDMVMVFPQGLFSKEAPGILKQNNYLAAVNTSVRCAGPDAPAVAAASCWAVAAMDYQCFPLFTRRPPSAGLENFAFDILLGKPCLVVVHHNDFRNGHKPLVKFIRRLNALKCALVWRGLGGVVRRSCRQRQIAPAEIEVEMSGTELRLENRLNRRMRYIVRKLECDEAAVKDMVADGESLLWNFTEGQIVCSLELDVGAVKTIRAVFRDVEGAGRTDERLVYRAKSAARRYMSEMRDGLQPYGFFS